MAGTPQPLTESVLGSTAAEPGSLQQHALSSAAPEARPEKPTGRSDAFDAAVEEIRRWYGSNTGDPLGRLVDLVRRRLGVAPRSHGAALLAGLTGSGIKLLAALLATALFGEWAGIPWGRWAVVLASYAVIEGETTLMSGPGDVSPHRKVRQVIEDWTALLPTIARESDLRDLADFTRRWQRLPAVLAAGIAMATLILVALALFTPPALSELPPGSIVLLSWLLFDFARTSVYWGNLFYWAFTAREARYDHDLFWASPGDSPEIHKAMRRTTQQVFSTGVWITFFLVMTVVLVGWESPLVLPLAVGFIVIGYLATIGAAFGNRASVRRIVERSRRQRLQGLQRRIATFGPRYTDLSAQESEQLERLLRLHNVIRDAPSSPTTARTLARTAAALILPTVMFVITVFGEVSAERFLDRLLP